MLIPSKHSGYQAGIRLYPGKSSAPKAPDYTSAAIATSAGNAEAARINAAANQSLARQTAAANQSLARQTAEANQAYARQTGADNLNLAKIATTANRANQYNPYGSLTWEKGATDYDPWTQRVNLSASGQRLLDEKNRQDLAYAQAATKGFDATKGLFENPNIDTSKMPEFSGVDVNALARAPINPGTTAQEAMLSRLNPSLANDEELLRTRLANQGIGLGSAAYSREMGLQGQRGNDLRLQAAAQGISLDQAARQQGLNEQLAIAGLNSGQRAQMLQEAYTKQSRPLDLINSLRTGSQVQNPQFQSYAQQNAVQQNAVQQGGVQQGGVQQQFTGGPDLLGAVGDQYNAQLSGVNARNAATAGMIQGIGSLAMAGATGGLFG
jgi:hypothetical protein